jgi:DNA-binding transcriptional LysR family regulator
VNITQSGVSAQIGRLEHELGATLIDRSGRTATLTVAGVAALEHARAVVASAAAVRHAVDDVNGLLRGRLVVGMVTACTVAPLFDALSTFHVAHPGIEIALYEDNSDRLVDNLRSGTTDLALIGAAGATPTGLEALTIVSERLVAAVPPGHPLTRLRKAGLPDISAYSIVSLPGGTGIRAVFDQGCAARGIRANIALEASAPGAVADLAIRGLGVAILSQSMVGGHDGRLHGVVIDDITMPALLALAWRTRPTPALLELVHHCRRGFTARAKPRG